MHKLEIGWLIVGELDRTDRAATESARDVLLAELRESLPAFDWVMPLVDQQGSPAMVRREPSELLEMGVAARDARGWDFVLVLTPADLITHYQPSAFATPASALGVAVISTARIDPQAEGRQLDGDARREMMAGRIASLALRLICYLNGVDLDPREDRDEHEEIAALDAHRKPDGAELEELRQRLSAVADPRLEEERRVSGVRFYVQASWRNARPILGSIARARPWSIPFRLSRLTTAAVSTVVVLVMTAEAWDVALVQSSAFLAVLSGSALMLTTWYVLRRQRLRLGRARLTEQAVATDVIAWVVVATGLLTTYLLLFALATTVAAGLFTDQLVDAWAKAARGDASDYLRVGSFLATLGILIGALGASFEERRYLHHITYVDREI